MADFEVRPKYISKARYTGCINEKPPLHQAVIYNKSDIVKLLIAFETDINIPDKYGRIPIAYVLEESQLKILDLLLAAGSKIYKLDEFGQMQFSRAFRSGHGSVIKEYLKYKINLNAKDSKGQTGIHYLMENRCDDIKYILEKLNFNVDVEDLRGQTPLLLAIENENLNCVQLLVKKRANVDYLFARQSKHNALHRCIKYCCRSDNIPNAFLRHNSLESREFARDCMFSLIKNVTEFNTKLNNYCTVLQLIFQLKTPRVIKAILKKLAIIETSGSPINEMNQKAIQQNSLAKSYYPEVKAELKKMRELQLHPNVSYFDILFEKNIDKLAEYFQNDKSRRDFKNNLCYFTHYYTGLLIKLTCGNQISEKEDTLSKIFNFSPHVTRKIVVYCFAHYNKDPIIDYM